MRGDGTIAWIGAIACLIVALAQPRWGRVPAPPLPPGRDVVLVDTPAGRIGLSVCYDMRFPELYRRLSAAGAEILVMPSAFTVPTGRAHWETLLRARAVENLCYVVAAAQSGVHPNGRETYGDTLIIDYWGRVLTRLPRGSGFVSAGIDRDALLQVRAEFPALQNRVLTS